MGCDRNSIRHQILDLLVDAPNPFSSLYRDLVNFYGYPREINCDYLLDVLHEMEDAGLLQAIVGYDDKNTTLSTLSPVDRKVLASEYDEWLCQAPLADLSFDKVGLCIEITELGRESWRNWVKLFGGDASPGHWQADFDFDNDEVIIVSGIESDARGMFGELCRIKRFAPIYSSLSLRPVKEYRLRNGSVLRSGVMLICKFTKNRI